MYILREEDKRSVYDPKYYEFYGIFTLEKFNLGFSVDLEPNLGIHPYNTDYIKLSNLNQVYCRKNMTESRKLLYEDETYPIINVHTRAAFLLSDGGSDSSRSLHFSNVRDDVMLRFARLLFRYRLNLDDLFATAYEPPIYEKPIKQKDELTD